VAAYKTVEQDNHYKKLNLRTSLTIHNRIIWDYQILHLLFPLKVQIHNTIRHAREHEDTVLEYDSTSMGRRIST